MDFIRFGYGSGRFEWANRRASGLILSVTFALWIRHWIANGTNLVPYELPEICIPISRRSSFTPTDARLDDLHAYILTVRGQNKGNPFAGFCACVRACVENAKSSKTSRRDHWRYCCCMSAVCVSPENNGCYYLFWRFGWRGNGESPPPGSIGRVNRYGKPARPTRPLMIFVRVTNAIIVSSCFSVSTDVRNRNLSTGHRVKSLNPDIEKHER